MRILRPFHRLLAIAALILAVLGQTALQTRDAISDLAAPQFSAFPADLFTRKRPALKLDPDDLSFRTRYGAMYREAPNFAGHYVVEVLGCGTECIAFLTLDVQSGRTVWLKVPTGEELTSCPESYRDAKGEEIFQDFYFHPDSHLFVVAGQMDGIECGALYFVERDGKMVPIRDIHLKKSS